VTTETLIVIANNPLRDLAVISTIIPVPEKFLYLRYESFYVHTADMLSGATSMKTRRRGKGNK